MKLPFEDPVLIFSTLLAVALFAPLLFQRIRLPGIIGLIVTGVAIGPNGIGVLDLTDTITLLGSVGLLYIMFLAGLEIDLHRFARQKNRSIVFGAITFAVPQLTGMAVFIALGFDWPAAILIASMFASHTLVAYPVINRLGITRNDAVATTVGGTILTDTAALLVLAVVARSTEGELTASFWMQLALYLSIYTVAVVTLLPRVGRWFFRRVEDQTAEFLFVLAAAFGCAYLARVAGIEPIVGAFLAGLVLNRLVPESSPLMNRTQFVGNALFIPFFLLYIGMLVDLQVLFGSAWAWIVMAAMLLTNIITKYIASNVTRRIYNYTREEGWIIFGLSTTEAAATLAATLVGYELGIIGDEVLNGVIMMILVTCLMGPSIVEHFGRKVAVRDRTREYDPQSAPQRIVVPLANPRTAESLLDVALMIRDNAAREPVYPLTVVPSGGDVIAAVARSEATLAHAVEYAAAAGVPVTPLTRVDPNVANGISRAIIENRATTVVAGWDGRTSLRPRIFGGTLDQLLHQIGQEVLVCRLTRPLNTNRRFLVVMPRHAEREIGFEGLIRTLKQLAHEAGASMHFMVEAEDIGDVDKHLKTIQPEVPLQSQRVDGAPQAIELIESTLSDSDGVVIISSRDHTVSWRPGLDRVPRLIAQRLPDSNLMVAYPSVTDSSVQRLSAGRRLQPVEEWKTAEVGTA